MTTAVRRVMAGTLLVIVVLLVPAGPAAAETRLFSGDAGPYAVQVTVDPTGDDPARGVTLTTFVHDRQAGRPVDDGSVTVTVRAPDGWSETLETTGIGNAYVSAVPEATAPWWQWTVQVDVDAAAGTADTSYSPPEPVDLNPLLPLPSLIAVTLGVAGIALVVARRSDPGWPRRVAVGTGAIVVVAAIGYGVMTYPGVGRAPADDEAIAGREQVLRGLCEATAAAPDDLAAAHRSFYTTVHQPIHGLAAELRAVDQPAAGALLVAKNDVERDLTTGARRSTIAQDLTRLLDTTQQGLQRLTGEPATCATVVDALG